MSKSNAESNKTSTKTRDFNSLGDVINDIRVNLPIEYLTSNSNQPSPYSQTDAPHTDSQDVQMDIFLNVATGYGKLTSTTIANLTKVESEQITNPVEVTVETEVINQFDTCTYEDTHDGPEQDSFDPSQLYVCPRCKACFATRTYLKSHMKRKCIRSQNIGHPHKCEYCDLSFKQKFQLTRHMMQHTGERPFKCDQCYKTFLTKSHLKRHTVIHDPHDQTVHKCSRCDKVFAWQSALDAHMKSHTGEKRFKCGICGRMFLHLNSLRSHMTNRHTVNGKYTCVVCKGGYDEPTDLIIHMKTHNEQESVKCDRCFAYFSSLKDLETHLCTNFGGKPLICHLCCIEFQETNEFCNHECMQVSANRVCGCCQKMLKSLWHLREHLITHTGEKPFKCAHCLNTFRRKRELEIHMTRHSGEKPFNCIHCNLAFSSDNYLKQHIRKEHREKKFVCEICNHSFMHKCSLTNHVRYHLRTGNTKYGKKYHRDDGLLVDELVKERLETEKKNCFHSDMVVDKDLGQTSTIATIPAIPSEEVTHNTLINSNEKVDVDNINVVDNGNIGTTQEMKAISVEITNLDHFSQYVIEPNSGNADDEPSNVRAVYQTDLNGILTVKCVSCIQDFSSHSELLRHRKELHNDGKPYQCDYCSRTFSVAANLSQHRSIHNVQQKYSCRHCGKSYKVTHKLREHLRIKHGEATEEWTDLELRLRNSRNSAISHSVLSDALVDSLFRSNSFICSNNISDTDQFVGSETVYHTGGINQPSTSEKEVTPDVSSVLFEADQKTDNVDSDFEGYKNVLSNIVFLDSRDQKSKGITPEQVAKRSDASFLMNLSSLITELGNVSNQKTIIQDDIKTTAST